MTAKEIVLSRYRHAVCKGPVQINLPGRGKEIGYSIHLATHMPAHSRGANEQEAWRNAANSICGKKVAE